MEEIILRDDFIKLGQLLKLANMVSSGVEAKIVIQNGEVKVNGETAGLVESGVEAKIVIQDGEVKVNGVVETQRGKKLFGGEVVEYNGSSILIKK